jgi:hypothetical protein
MKFKRTVSKEMIEALNAEYLENGWWKTLADDKDTLIAIRDRYLNVYYNGGSIAKVEYATGKIEAQIHYKYLLKKKLSNPPYVRCIDGKPQIEVHAAIL